MTSQDEKTGREPPVCAQCNAKMWLVNVGRDRQQPADAGVRIFECKECGAARIVTG